MAILGDYIRIKHGFAFKGDFITTEDNGVVLVTPGNFEIGGGFKEKKCKFFSDDYPTDYVLHPGDLIVTMTDLSKQGDTLGFSALVPNSQRTYLHNQRIGLVDVFNPEADKGYIYWFMRTPRYQKTVVATSSGSTVKHTSPSRICEVEIDLPPLNEQKAIAAMLSSIEQKIQNNDRINDNLQQQLFSLYENIAMTSPCSKEDTLSNLCDFQEGYVNPAQTHPEFFDGEVKWLRAVDINESFITETSRTLTRAGFESAKKSALLFKPNTIAISKSGTIGRLGIIADYMCGNRAVINIAPHDANMLAYIYCFLKSKQREFPDMAVGSVQKNLYVSLLEPLSVSMPDDESLTTFNAAGASILDMIRNNCVENTKLANLRDTILPKLMSGEIDVSDIQL